MLEMWIVNALLLLSIFVVVDSRVTFTTSEVLDNVDLMGTNTAPFRCFAGCRVYSPTKNAQILIADAAGNEFKTLMDLSTLKTGESYELPKTNAGYVLKNKGAPNPAFVFYAVEKGAMNYMTNVAYVDLLSAVTLSAKNDQMFTVMSASGAVRFSDFKGDYTAALPSVFATGADSVTYCRPLYTASSPSLALTTTFPVNSPIATINFKQTGVDTSVVVSGDYTKVSYMDKDTSAVFVSPGYVGCPSVDSVGDLLYTFLPPVGDINQLAYLTDTTNGGLTAEIDGYYSIEKEKDAIELTVNEDVMELFGKSTISKTYDGITIRIKVDWLKNVYSKDGFALQINIASKGANAQKTTQKSSVQTTSGTPVATTSESVNSFTMIVSFAVVSLFMASR